MDTNLLGGISSFASSSGNFQSQATGDGNFLTRVSFAGVPHTLPHSDDTSLATLYPISPELACKLYWLLSSLSVSYAYSINGVQVSRSFSASTTMIPKNRMITPAMIYETAYDPQFQTSYLLEMYPDRVYFNGEDNSKVGFNLRVEEADNLGIMKLSLRPEANMDSVSLPFTFMEQTFPAYLNYNTSLVNSASLTNFSLTPQFFVI
jgi:hypothetical protein